MRGVRELLPETGLSLTRLGAAVLAIVSLAGQIPQIGRATGSPARDIAAFTALALIAAAVLVSYRRGRLLPGQQFVLPVLAVVAGSAFTDPVATVGIAIVLVVVQSLYGPTGAWAIGTVLTTLAVPAAIRLSAQPDTVAAGLITILSALPQVVLLAGMTRAIHGVLRRQEMAAGRDATLATAGSRLLAATDVPDVHRIATEMGNELVALSPGVLVLILIESGDGLEIKAVMGGGGQAVGALVPRAALTDPAAHLADLAPGFRHWRVDQLTRGRYRLIGGRRPVPDQVVNSFRTLANQVRLCEDSRQTHAELDRQANHDHLTQLANRAGFFRSLAEAVDNGEPGSVALLAVDLDDFKQVNDTYGHAAGDELLVHVAARLRDVAGGRGIPARFGGDEFALLLTDLTAPVEAEQIAELLCVRLVAPMQLTAATVTVGASIGVALTEPGVRATELIRRSDIAMYSAKARGKNRVEIFAAHEHGQVARHRMLEDQIPYALERDEIALFFQPYADLRTGAWIGVEALVQWQHPVLGEVNCRELFMLAERTGQLATLTAWVLKAVGARVAALPDLPIGLNVNAGQLLDPRFTGIVLDALAGSGLPADRLILEIVESARMDDPVARDQLHRLAVRGVRIALDDFGGSHVSLASLGAYPIHQIKVDATYLSGDPGSLDLVLALGQLLGTETVVQGVTDAQQLDRLSRTSATGVQGPLLCPIVSGDQLIGQVLRSAHG